jgi:aldehyde dehydrogenase (NAD+)
MVTATLAPPAPPATAPDLRALFDAQRAHQSVMARTTAAERRQRLRRLRDAVAAHRAELCAAVLADFGRPAAETELTEIHSVLSECDDAIRHVGRWMKPERAGTPLMLFGTSSRLVHEPRGVALIIAPWNYPIGLLLNPLVAAIASGNCAICKPSEKTPHVAALLHRMLTSLCDAREVAVVLGAADVAQSLLELPFDHICFTGSPQIGKLVMAAAAKNLASVTLELGGKSPTIVDETADVRLAAERVAIGKFMNAGQTCVAPDYVLVHRSREAAFLEALRATLATFYGAGDAERRGNPDFARLVDGAAFARLKGLLDRTVAAGARIVTGGDSDAGTRYLAPTVLADVPRSSPIMQEEIFGPILPVLAYDTADEVVQFIRAGTKPLAMYIFSASKDAAEFFISSTSAGATVVGNIGMHYFHHGLPFGGVGASGMGAYHGVYGFREFSHARPVIRQREPALVRMFFPPYREGSLGQKVLRLLERL